MPDYSQIRDLVSHRVTFDFDTGARIVGYITGAQPNKGVVQVVNMSRVDVLDSNGKVLEHHDVFSFVPNVMTGFRITEGPGGF